eukprot:820951-Rhodomonas_salina.2
MAIVGFCDLLLTPGYPGTSTTTSTSASIDTSSVWLVSWGYKEAGRQGGTINVLEQRGSLPKRILKLEK